MPLGGDAPQLEHALELEARLPAGGPGGHPLVLDQGPVEAPRPVVQQLAEHHEGRFVDVPVRHGVVADDDLRVRLGVGVHALLAHLRHLARARLRRGPVAPRQAAEVALGQRLRLVGVEVADEGRGEVVGRVVQVEERQRLGAGDALDVARPADHRPTVGGRLPEQRVELLFELAGRGAVGAQPPLLVDDVALGVELAEHRVHEPVRLHPEPQLELVGGDVHEVEGEVVARARVHPRGALPRVDPAEVLLDDQLLLLREEVLEPVHQRPVALGAVGGVGRVPDAPQPLGLEEGRLLDPQGRLHLVELGDDLQILLDVPGADGRGALEHHVFEEVCDPGDAGPLVDRSDLGHPTRRHVRVPRPR